MIVLLYFCCFVLKYQSVKELLRTHVCHVDLYILLPTLNKIYLITYLLNNERPDLMTDLEHNDSAW